MVVQTDSERVRLSHRLVLELLASSVDLALASALAPYLERDVCVRSASALL
jgi:hypothetical protein